MGILMHDAPPQPAASTPPAIWVLDLRLDLPIVLADGLTVDRDGFTEWLWACLGDTGLAGIAEGEIDVAEATTAGIVNSPLVIDAAEAPADRDWVREAGRAMLACWFDAESAARSAATALGGVRGCSVVGVRGVTAADDNDWREAFAPIEVAGFGVVRPAWDSGAAEHDDRGAAIFIEPGAGFGTGLHETTQLCLAAIREWWATAGRPLGRVLDFGAGSGILGIAAAVLGAAHVHAVEVDRSVHGAIAANAARNGVVDRVTVTDRLPSAEAPFDLVVANIVADVLFRHADDLCDRVRRDAATGMPAGVVLSGLLAADVAAVEAAFTARLGVPPRITTRGDWCCLVFMPGVSTTAGGHACR